MEYTLPLRPLMVAKPCYQFKSLKSDFQKLSVTTPWDHLNLSGEYSFDWNFLRVAPFLIIEEKNVIIDPGRWQKK